MRDNSLRQVITGHVSNKIDWRNLAAGLLVAVSVGAAGSIAAAWSMNPTDDDLAKLAELAACSTGQPASTIWLAAQEDEGWSIQRGWKIAKRLLVQIDVDRCGVRQAPHANADKGKIWAFPPGERYN